MTHHSFKTSVLHHAHPTREGCNPCLPAPFALFVLFATMAEEEKSMVADGAQDGPIGEKPAAFCLEGTMMERARNSGVGDGDLHDPRALAMEQLLTCSLVTEETKQFCLINDRQLVVAFIQACANVPCLAAAVWPLIESLGDDQDALANVNWMKCSKLRCHPNVVTKPWFRWIVGVPDKEGNTGLMALCGRGAISDVIYVVNRYGDACNPGHTNKDGNNALMIVSRRHGRAVAASKLITAFGVKCQPGQVNKDGNTAFMILLQCCLGTAATELLTTFGLDCMPGHVSKDGNTALMAACKSKQFSVAAALIEAYGDACNPAHANSNGETALMLVVSGRLPHRAINEACALIQLFGRFGVATLGTVDRHGNTALMLAFRQKRIAVAAELAAALIEAFGIDACDPGSINTKGETALMLAFSQRHHCNSDELSR